MAIWSARPVTEQPHVTLVRWKVYETERNERHFVGYCLEEGIGRVSSAIQSFDPKTGRGVTLSGRVYQLKGSPGFDGDAEYVWNLWSIVNQVQTCQDVTDAIFIKSS
jgi:hypothetical protein